MGYVRTGILMAALTALFIGLGALLGGQTGAIIALVIAAGMNAFTYWNSDQAVLRMQDARPVSDRAAPDLIAMVRHLAQRAGLPMPAVYIIETDQPNAFATGRSPDHAAVAVTRGLLQSLNRDELAGVIAHELAHIKSRDTLTMTIAATFAGAISMLANFALFFGRDRNNLGLVGTLAMMILAPMAAGLVQMAISRSREYEADRIGAEISGDPLALASALRRIETLARRRVNPLAERNPAAAHMFIINPLNGQGMDNLFATHPSTDNRVAALQRLARQSHGSGQAQARGAAMARGAVAGGSGAPGAPWSRAQAHGHRTDRPGRQSGPWGKGPSP